MLTAILIGIIISPFFVQPKNKPIDLKENQAITKEVPKNVQG